MMNRTRNDFRTRHAMLTLHVWFLHKRLVTGSNNNNNSNSNISTNENQQQPQPQQQHDLHFSYLIQEELFDLLWHDTKARIRHEGLHEMTVEKHLRDVQQYTFQQCCHLDEAFVGFDPHDNNNNKRSVEKTRRELIQVAERHLLLVKQPQDKTTNDDNHRNNKNNNNKALSPSILRGDANNNTNKLDKLIHRLVMYIEYQYINIMKRLPDSYFQEGRVGWVNPPSFEGIKITNNKQDDDMNNIMRAGSNNSIHHNDNDNKTVPEGWIRCLTDAGKVYYWHLETNKTVWELPSSTVTTKATTK